MLIVDSHCHLNFPDFQDDREAVIAHARESGVGVMQTICTKMSEFEEIRAIAENHDDLYCSVGIHPHHTDEEQVTEETLLACTKHPKVIGIGETGLDYFYKNSDKDSQINSFCIHINVARESGLPLIIHTREADDDTIAILEKESAKGAFPFLIHCFSSSHYLAEKSIELGGYISISGIVSFKKAVELQESVRILPLERLLVETDSPYLAPAPHRGKRNEPAYTRRVAEVVAELKGLPLEEVARVTTDNFFSLFCKAKKPTSTTNYSAKSATCT